MDEQQQNKQQQNFFSARRGGAPGASVDTKLYDTLGVARNATDREIKFAYRRKASEYHPDKSTGDKEKMQEINHAYEILGNPEKRRVYDLGGLGGVQQQQQRQSASAAHNAAAKEMFKKMFGDAFASADGGVNKDDSDDVFSTTGPGGGMPGAFFSFRMGGGSFNGAARPPKEPELRLEYDISFEHFFAQGSFTLECQVKRRQAATTGTTAATTLVVEQKQFKITFKCWNDLRNPILLRGKGNQNIDEKIQDGDIIVRFNLLDNEFFAPCNSHDMVLRRKISFQDSLCGFDFTVPFIDSYRTCLRFTSDGLANENQVIYAGMVFQCPLGLPKKELDKTIHFNPLTTNEENFGLLYIVFDVEEPEQFDNNDRQLLASRLASRNERKNDVIRLKRAPPRIEMQLCGEMLARKANERALRRSNVL